MKSPFATHCVNMVNNNIMKRLAYTMAALSTFAAFSCKGPAAQPQAESKVLVLIDLQNDFIDGSLGS